MTEMTLNSMMTLSNQFILTLVNEKKNPKILIGTFFLENTLITTGYLQVVMNERERKHVTVFAK